VLASVVFGIALAVVPNTSDGAAASLAANWPAYVNTRMSYARDQAWSQLLNAPRSSVVGGPDHLVRLTAGLAPGSNASLLFETLFTDDLATLIGTCPPSTGTAQKCTL
jgi:hypothetical protein